MKKTRPLLAAAVLCVGVAAAGCDLDVSNPNALSEGDVLGSAENLLALTVGMQDVYAGAIDGFVQGPALVTDEWGTGTRSLSSYRELLTGDNQPLDNDLGVIEEPWAAAYRVVRIANDVIANASGVGLAADRAAGVTATAKLFKAMSLGTLILQFERIPVDVTVDDPVPQPRDVVLDSVLALLESARQDAAGADVAFLNSRVLGSGFDLVNTIDLMLARYYLIDGQYAAAADAAARVDLSVVSLIPYTGTDVNQIFNMSGGGLGYVFPLASFAAEAEAGDQRPAYWVDADGPTFTGNPDSVLVELNQYSERNDPYLAYVPDEATLIRAEAAARLGDLPTARTLINQVRTQTGVQPDAGLPALPVDALDTLDEVLAQIAYERRYELYEQGLRWEDMRRLGQYIDEAPTYDFFPIPRQECITNANACP